MSKTAIEQVIEMQMEHLQVMKDNRAMHNVLSLDYARLSDLISYLESSIKHHLPDMLPIEKQQIIGAYAKGGNDQWKRDHSIEVIATDGEQYYSETFKTQYQCP